MPGTDSIKVLVNGYGVIGKRVADAVNLQNDMELVGVVDISTDYRIKGALEKEYSVFAATPEAENVMKQKGVTVRGTLEQALEKTDVVVDATPKGVGVKNKSLYKKTDVKSIFQGGEPHTLTGFSFVAQANYDNARSAESVRCVSCNTTGLTRIIHALHKDGLVKKVRGSLFRRGTDPWESHINGIINTAVPEETIPSHQSPDVQTILPDVDITTIAASGPFNLSHLHTLFIELHKEVPREKIIDIYHNTPRVAFVRKKDGVAGLHSVIEIMRDLNRPRNDMWEVAIWEDVIRVKENELMIVYQVHNEAIVVPENIDAVRAIAQSPLPAEESIKKTDESLGVRSSFTPL